jgi:hypothetical protein
MKTPIQQAIDKLIDLAYQMGNDDEVLDSFSAGERRGYLESATILAPLYQQAFRWFREKHQIEATVACYYSKILGISYEERQYHCYIVRDGITTKGPKFKTYEESESACIDNVKEKVYDFDYVPDDDNDDNNDLPFDDIIDLAEGLDL